MTTATLAIAPLWVIVPAHNEAQRLESTLNALAQQTDLNFTLAIVDNASTDATATVARQFAERSAIPVIVLSETEKGVGCAVDTGFRYAIGQGALHLARTDADCVPGPGWVAAARSGLAEGADLVCGKAVARRDENGVLARLGFRLLVVLAAVFGRLRAANRGAHYLAPYRMHAGNNMAITAACYLGSGGMPRRPSPTDRTFLNAVRAHTKKIVVRRDMVVGNSTRRLRAYGLRATAAFYLDKGSGPRDPDPR